MCRDEKYLYDVYLLPLKYTSGALVTLFIRYIEIGKSAFI